MSSLSFTIIQANLEWENKQANLDAFEKKIKGIKQPAQVIVLPEMFSTGFSMSAEKLAEEMDGPSVQWMKRLAASEKKIITGSLIIKEKGNYYNRMIWMLPNGEYGFYDKRHLFAFAGEDEVYTGGNKRLICRANGWRMNLNVCYDLRFPVWSRQQFSDAGFEYDVLINVANWPERRSFAWRSLLIARAIENQCYVIGVNRVGDDANGIHYSGNSMVVDPLGNIIYEKVGEEDVKTLSLEMENLKEVREKFQFWRDGDEFKLL